jgi:short subunit dehydrogenase-like uncharacterized protein
VSARALVYGATGYTGRLIARLAPEFGVHPVLAGRDPDAVRELAHALGLDHRAFPLDDPGQVRKGLKGIDTVLNCAGPFAHTWRPLAGACLDRGAHYLDVTGEIEVLEALAARDDEARAAGVMLLPSVGFDVVPTDCLAAHLKRRLPTARRLLLGVMASGRISRGTAITMVENWDRGGMIRRSGRAVRVPAAWRTREIDFGRGPRGAVTIPWGDVTTAWHSTRIPDIEVYAAAPRAARTGMRVTRPLGPLMASATVKAAAKWMIRHGPPGPSDAELGNGFSVVWGRVEDDAGGSAEGRLHCPNAYLLTARAALHILRRVLHGETRPGFATPSLAFGPDLPLELAGVSREDLI